MKSYNMGAELKTLGAVITEKPTPRATRYQKYDAVISKKPTAGYNKFNPSVLPEKDQTRVDLYHATRGKK